MILFLINLRHPTWKPDKVDLPIVVCKKRVWVELPNGHRKLIGASAFFTLASAERARAGLLNQLIKNSYVRNMYPDTWKKAKYQLSTIH